MDKKSIIGLVLIGVILFGFTWYSQRQQADYTKEKAVIDSINAAHTIERINSVEEQPAVPQADAAAADSLGVDEAARSHYGNALYNASQGTEQIYTMENEVMRLVFSNKGGRVATVELKDYKRYSGGPLMLFAQESSVFDMMFYVKHDYNTFSVNTKDYYFEPVGDVQDLTFAENEEAKTFTMRLHVDSTAHIDYIYTVLRDNYMVDFDVRFVGMEQKLAPGQSDLSVIWKQTSYQNEKGFENENTYTTIAYNFPGELSIEELRTSTEARSERINSWVGWVAFKQQFFSSILLADNDFQNADVDYVTYPETADSIKTFNALMTVPFSPQTSECNMQFYFGPNKYSVLKKYDQHLERLVPLGGWLVGWINRWLVIPVFDILGRFISSFGIIILLLTIIIKIIISPLTYKSYLSTARMRLLKPEMDEIAKKYPKPEDAMKKQQATMELYKSAGVSPMGGCLPMLIQFPILIAMFRFFPASIELRGESFLWADDLSSYDSVLNLPFDIPFYGSHVSLFALLMAVSIYITSRINYNQTAGTSQQMPGMKFMMLYMMPVMMLFWFNNYSSGLSYYFLVSNLFTMLQTYATRYLVSDEKLHRQMKENAKKPKKKSKWQERYSEMLKQQQQQQQAAKRK